jgi:hypothetical protein
MEKAKTYFVVEAAEGLTLAGQVNHVVRITGTAEQKPQAVAPPGGKVSDKDWPKLRAKAVTVVANVCTNGRP